LKGNILYCNLFN